ncbi:MAG: hypothetical protein A3K19_11365 [Lentisphaerae bacterium RIFOXYB12_FULL_65_16]|nr:MAG: hypothetical protein A3K18_25065 [Lentisphaerae bacterium RIFOXYA12_64_32]OGV90166.1 MAG: hypothetical protein A3K19_11365 [Lentisphaerae bacterium RIFOXYB12_FULL_65_16]
MTLLITLGFLSVLMMLALTFILASRTERKAAGANADLVRTRLLAESAIERVKAQMQSEFQGKVYPADSFFNAASGLWQGRRCLPSCNGADTAGIQDALASTSGELQYTPNAPLHSSAGWVPIHSTRSINGVDRRVLMGRYSYVIMDDSGKIDPSSVVDVSSTEDTRSTPRTGASVTEINLSDAGIANANKFRPNTATCGEVGLMPADARWFSLAHMVRAMKPDLSQSQFNQIVNNLYPFSSDVEKFWRDANGNGTWDEGEDADRLNIAAAPTMEQIYNTFVGATRAGDDAAAGADDCAWLKDVDNDGWFQDWKNTALASVAEPLRTVQARQFIAAQVAANMVDYADIDSVPTRAYLDTGGNIHEGSYAGTFNIQGAEKTWGVSEIALKVEADQYTTAVVAPPPPDPATDDVVTFDLTNGATVPTENFKPSITVLGSDLVNWGYRQKVTVQVVVGGDTYEPFGPSTQAVTANVGDDANPRTFEIPKEYAAGTSIAIRIKYWKKTSTSLSGTQNSHWTNEMTTYSTDASAQCRIRLLRDGDNIPNVPGFQNQTDAAYYVANYVNNNKMSMTVNQSIFLFEHTSDLGGAGADFQDAVCLITLVPGTPTPPPPVPVYDFTITNGTSVPTGRFFLTVKCLGSNLVNWGYRQPCTVKVKVGSTWYEPWGSYTTPVGSNVGDDNNPRTYSFPDAFPENTPVSVQVKFWKKVRTTYSGALNSHWTTSREVYSALSSDFNRTYVLRNNSPVPNVAGFQNQASAKEYVKDYISGGLMKMADDEAIYLFEHTTDPTSSGADFQDAIVLVSMVDEMKILNAGLPPVAPPPNATPSDPAQGNALRFRVGLKGEIFFPYGTNANTTTPPGTLTVACTAEVNTATGETKRVPMTSTIALAQATNVAGGTMMSSADFDCGDWVEVPNAFNYSVNPPLNWYTVSLLQIDSITLKDNYGNTVDSFPGNGSFFCNWSQGGTSTDDASMYVSAKSYDPLMNDRSVTDPDFFKYWSISPADRTQVAATAEALTADVGTLTYGGYAGADYCDIQVKNNPILRLGEIGRIHSYQPLRSVRLWAASTADEQGSDTAILDVFRTAPGLERRGKVNINTLEPAVLQALFADASTTSASTVASTILGRRAAGTVFTNIGQVFAINGVGGSSKGNDWAEEDAVGKVAELITCRQNYFTVIACAQAVKDIAGIPYTTLGETTPRVAAYDQMDVKQNPDGTVDKYIDRILAEQKMQIVVYRDAFSNRIKVERIEYLTE